MMEQTGPILLVGGGPVQDRMLEQAIERAVRIIAVDGGARHLQALGVSPDVIIGDLDSTPPSAFSKSVLAEQKTEIIHITNQDNSDFEKALSHFGAGNYHALGFTGGRIDHQLAVLDTMLRYPQCTVLLIDEFNVSFLIARQGIRWNLPIDTTLSLTALKPTQCQVCHGLAWSIIGWDMALGTAMSLSNRVVDCPIKLRFADHTVLLSVETNAWHGLQPTWRSPKELG
ncbi:MAG: thiamine diphosphokinase [Pseudomonadota bacterium]